MAKLNSLLELALKDSKIDYECRVLGRIFAHAEKTALAGRCWSRIREVRRKYSK